MSDQAHGSGQDMDQQGSMVAGSYRPGLTSAQKIGIAALLLVVFLAFIWISALRTSKSGESVPQADATFSSGQDFRTPPPAPAPAPQIPLPQPAAAGFPAAFTPFPVAPQHRTETAADSPIMAFSGSLTAPAAPPPAESDPTLVKATAPASAPNALSIRLKSTIVQPTKATLLPHPDFLLTEGTIIPCTLQTAIDSQLPGYVKCVIPRDIRSTTGDVVLLDKGTQVIGEIHSGLMQGQNRIFVLWDRAETPQHAVIALDSPGTDELGRSGLPGAIDTHFLQRFGSAIMLSVIQGGLQAGTALASNLNRGNNSNSLNFNSFSGNGQELADTALQASLNIPPTLEKNQGDNIAIFVARDLDFSDVYKLRVNAHGQ